MQCLFKLHLPSRYTQYSFRIILVLAAGIVLTTILEALARQLASKKIWQLSKKYWLRL